ncbi:L-fuculose kinase [Streptococcus macedonicus]|uniref:L-fuculose kinase n=1 Tax=Streptococcus macedonicus TaxID=59310 RepID=A0A2I1YFD7_STRMC|nr:L-fuculose kinase [Streptococcus macedonicus]QCE37801.1 L-fuculose kinase [Streptococcus pasteurianus]RGB44684.1 L-fuculose kinase [Streptococcus gallolyticus]RGB47777.1 L-fuculose kinase [Streptococcus pasteurianus]RGC03060.1 L-fuculose kinase [Streptococcus pasteurianus]
MRLNHLTDGESYVIIMNGTFYFWSLQSVQRRADKCCKVHILDKDCHQVPYQPK